MKGRLKGARAWKKIKAAIVSRRTGQLTMLALTAATVQAGIFMSAAGEEQALATTYTYGPINQHYFPWYDSKYGTTWVLMANPWGAGGNYFDVFLGNDKLNSSSYAVNDAPFTPAYPGKMGGPLKVVPQETKPVLISERSLFGNSFEEIWATPYEQLDSHYYWPWYDSSSPGMQNWILVSNPNSERVWAQIKIDMNTAITGIPDKVESRLLDPGQSWTPIYPGWSGGPVEVKAWHEEAGSYDAGTARKVIASQRVLWNGAFNEMPGQAATNLSSDYFWTWYDNQNGKNEIWVANQNSFDIWVRTLVLNPLDMAHPVIAVQGKLTPGQAGMVSKPGMGGPVYVEGCADANWGEACNQPAKLISSQRTYWGPSFGEIAGTPSAQIGSDAHWTWYDQLPSGVSNWVLVSNLSSDTIYVEYKIAGQLVKTQEIGAFTNYSPTFPGKQGGPVEVNAWRSEKDPVSGQQLKTTPAAILASQRVVWQGYFNEVVGKAFQLMP